MSWESLNSQDYRFGEVSHQLSATRLLSSPDGSRHPLDGFDQSWPWYDSFSSLHREAYTEVHVPRSPLFAFSCFHACRTRIRQRLAKRKVEQGVKLYDKHKQQQAVKKWRSALKAVRRREDKFLVLGYLYRAYMDWGKYR
ncbi:uncharacterized protein LOC112905855 [Agrilus planipennis]|uniref:Uncharacterized protein LOC112905855 n=1 Tax=Agrilus planipennis TaxID=224129 RepID=A0A7F5RG67_AGRPL|nr:uncharacterized protein LOC112905855 [Agrilus planipennis]